MRRFNNWLANKLASFMATMLLFWLLLIVDVVGAIVDPPVNAQAWLLWGVSILFQSVALPVIALVSNKQGDRMESLLRETHDATLAELAELREMHEELHAKHTGLVDAVQRFAGGERDE